MNFTDAVSVAGTRLTDDGYLEASALSVRTGIQQYRASELGLVGDGLIAVYRPEAEVFHKDSVASFARKPVTVDHPAEMVTAESWDAVAVGETDSEVMRDGQRLRIPMTIRSADAIRAIQDGKRQLSAGYTCDLDWAEGKTPDGQHYDAIQTNIRANHIAIVARGRAGAECRIGDADSWGATPVTMSDKKEDAMSDALKTVVLGDEAVQVAAADAAKIDKWKADQAKALADAEDAHTKAIEAKDEEIGTLKADLKTAKDALPKPGDLDRMVADRAALVESVKLIAKDVKAEGLSDADLRKAAVATKFGDEAVKDASEAEIKGMFTAISKSLGDGKADPVRGALKDAKVEDHNAEYRQRLADAWKTPVKEG